MILCFPIIRDTYNTYADVIPANKMTLNLIILNGRFK